MERTWQAQTRVLPTEADGAASAMHAAMPDGAESGWCCSAKASQRVVTSAALHGTRRSQRRTHGAHDVLDELIRTKMKSEGLLPAGVQYIPLCKIVNGTGYPKIRTRVSDSTKFFMMLDEGNGSMAHRPWKKTGFGAAGVAP